ncbi:MAG: serine hydrolase domain-containing protein [Methanobacterium sp.]
MKSKLNKIVTKIVDHKKVFGCVVNVESGDNTFSWIGSAGNISNKTLYFIASTTKLYITAILLKLRSEGQIKLEDKISKYIPIESISGIHNYKGTDYSDKITIEQLMAHTSGLPDYFEEKTDTGKSLRQELSLGHDSSWDFQKVMNDVKKLKPKFKPGAPRKALYSDTNYQLLGRIIEIITNKSIGDAFNDLIFTPLNLKNTYLYQDISDKTPIDIYFKKQQMHIPQAMASFGPDGGIVSTAEEAMIFLKAFFNGIFFQKKVIDELKHWNNIFFPLEYGIGIMKFKLPRIFSPFQSSPEFIGHSGLSGAFEWYCQEKDLYLTGTVNQSSNPDLSFKLLIKIINSFKN